MCEDILFANEIIRLLQGQEHERIKSESGIAQARKFNPRESASALVQLF
jgi:hypothetical protein